MEREKLNLDEITGSSIKKAATETVDSAAKMTERVGEALGSAGQTLRQHLPGMEKASEAAETVTRSVKQTADYLQAEGMSGIVEDLEVLIRRYPLQTLLLGVGCGYLLSRLRTD